MSRPPPTPPLFPYTTLFRSRSAGSSCSPGGGSWKQPSHKTPETLDLTKRDAPPTLGVAALLGLVGLVRSEEHTSELQSQSNLVCRLLLEKKKKKKTIK